METWTVTASGLVGVGCSGVMFEVPTTSGVSPDGALGFTTGTWRWTPGAGSGGADGSWKVLVDTGG